MTKNEHLLGHHADGVALAMLRLGYNDGIKKNYYITGKTITSPSIMSASPQPDPTDAHLTDCWSAANYQYVSGSTHKVIGAGSKTGYTVHSEVQLEHGVWKVIAYSDVAGPACTPVS